MKKFHDSYKISIPEFIYSWANSEECIFSLSAVRSLVSYGFSLDDIKLWNKAAITANKKGLKKLVENTCKNTKVIYSICGKHGKTYGLQLIKDGYVVRDTSLFLESQI